MVEDTPTIPSPATLSRVLLAGIGGVAGSFALAGFTPSFIAAPIAGLLAREMPAIVIRYSILFLGSLGQKLNLATAIGISILLLSLLALAGIEAERRFEAPFLAPTFAAVAGAVFGLLLTRGPLTALGVGGGMGAVMAVSELLDHVDRLDETFDPQRRTVLGGLAALAGIGAVGAVRHTTGRSASLPEAPEALSGGGDPTTPAPSASTQSAAAHTRTPKRESKPPAEPAVSTPTPIPPSERSEIDQLLREASEKSLEIEGLEPLVSESFYEVDINAVNPEVDTEDWSLSITGAVESERTYSWRDITAMPAENRFATLRCVGDRLNGRKMDNALWTGVPVNRLLEKSTPKSDCECVMLRAADGFYEEFPLEALRGGLLAYGMNGELLPRRHGQPLRALVPGHWGEVNVKWLTEIELLERETDGYWEKRGWHGTGPVHTVAKLHAINILNDGRIQVGGHAYAGTRGIEQVEVSVDGSRWETATLSEPLPGDDVWRQWVYEYEPPDGPHEVIVRAVDGTGILQRQARSQPYPDGATGWVSRTV